MNPFLHNHQEDEGSFPERLHIRHALASRKAVVPDVDSEWKRLRDRIEEREEAERRRHAKRRLIRAGIAAAVAVVVAVAGIIIMLTPSAPDHGGGMELYIAEAPKGGCITVTTSGGVKRVVAPKVARNAPSVIDNDGCPEDMVVIEIPAGQEFAVMLPDSSRVWLWANSRLEYPAQFEGTERVVTLCGDAYFDVAPSAERPFIVHTEYFNTRVYGTEFVVRASERKNAEVLLVEGCVGVSTGVDGEEAARLQSGQEASLTPEGFDVTDFDPYPLQQWRDGMFFFEDNELLDVLVTLGKWYGVSIVAYNDEVLRRRLHFVADRTGDIEPVIEDLNAILSGRKVVYENGQISLY